MKVKVVLSAVCVICTAILAWGAINSSEAASILIPVAEFTIDGGTNAAPGNFYKLFSGGYLQGGTGAPCFVAPVRIPDNATRINKVIVYLKDTDAVTDKPWFQLDALEMSTGTVTNYTAGQVTTGTSTIQGILLPLSQKAVTPGRTYQLGTCLNGSEQLYGVKVVYSTTP